MRDHMVYGLEGFPTGAGYGFPWEEVCGVGADEGVPGDEPDQGGEDGAIAAS
jgi:hypothetical protein